MNKQTLQLFLLLQTYANTYTMKIETTSITEHMTTVAHGRWIKTCV